MILIVITLFMAKMQYFFQGIFAVFCMTWLDECLPLTKRHAMRSMYFKMYTSHAIVTRFFTAEWFLHAEIFMHLFLKDRISLCTIYIHIHNLKCGYAMKNCHMPWNEICTKLSNLNWMIYIWLCYTTPFCVIAISGIVGAVG